MEIYLSFNIFNVEFFICKCIYNFYKYNQTLIIFKNYYLECANNCYTDNNFKPLKELIILYEIKYLLGIMCFFL